MSFNIVAQFINSGRGGKAVIRDLSSSGAFLTLQVVLPVGKRERLFVDWPDTARTSVSAPSGDRRDRAPE
jgi:hypothetical protein